MPSAHSALTAAIGSQVYGLGPGRISARYPAKPVGEKQTLMRNITFTDDSGSIDITLWAEAAQLPIYDGQVGTFTGPMKREDYQGKPKLSARAGLSFAADGNASAQQATGGSQSNAGGSGQSRGSFTEEKISFGEMALQMAAFTKELRRQLVLHEIPAEAAIQILGRAPEYAALWWFGAKSLNMQVAEDPQQQQSENEPFPY